jgi:hypothetical protein
MSCPAGAEGDGEPARHGKAGRHGRTPRQAQTGTGLRFPA